MELLITNQCRYMQLMGNVAKILAQNIAAFRKQLGMTQETLAERAGLSATAIAHFETERRWPERETIRKLADALGVQEERLFIPADWQPSPTLPEAIKAICSALNFDPPRPKKSNVKKN